MIFIDFSNFVELKKKSDEIIKKGWLECSSHNSGNAGLLLERLLGLQNHNFSIPDYNGIEIKTKFINSVSRMTLFNATPDGYLFTTKRIYETYAYPDHTNNNFKVFHSSFSANKKTYVNKNIYGKLYVDREKRKVILRFYNKNFKMIDGDTSWSFDLLQERMDIKLKYLFIMYVRRTRLHSKTYCRYLYYDFFHYKGFEYFLRAIENGYIKITFSIDIFKTGRRAGTIHDHGTSFDIDIEKIPKVFEPLKFEVSSG